MSRSDDVSPLTTLLSQLSENEKLKGDQFESLAKWYLENDPLWKAKFINVWHFREWEGRWSNTDLGTDLIAEDTDGKFWAIQAKGYKPGSSIKFVHMGTFLADSAGEGISYRLLVTSTDSPSPRSNTTNVFDRQIDRPVIVVDRSMLERASVTWPKSFSELDNIVPQPEPKDPFPYQARAIDDLVSGFAAFDRGQLIMPPGTGKTLTSVFFADKIKAQNILVLVPSLALLGQTMVAWRQNITTLFKSLPVGSDESIKDPINDGAGMKLSEVGFPITTKPEDIARFLAEPGMKVVFSTYQSAPQVEEAQKTLHGHEFDLAIADEAHHTAGPMVALFATILHDEKIRATRRLFMTATQRGFGTALLRQGLELDFERASMDDDKIYGPVFHRLPFGQAIKDGLITDYRIVIPAVTDDSYRMMAEDADFIRINGVDVVDARKVASHIALLRAIRKYDLHTTIAFLNTNKKARDFAQGLYETWEWMPDDLRPTGELWSEPISGEMPSRQRNKLLDYLRGPHTGFRKVLSNVRVLSEGVDIPALTAIMFVEPKRSPIEIIQAIGRVVRLDRSLPNPAEQIGYVIIPAFVPHQEHVDPEAVLAQSAFKQIARTFQVLATQDERLTETVNRVRRGLGPWSKGGSTGPKLEDKQLLEEHLETDLAGIVGDDFARAFLLMLVKSASASFEEFVGRMEQYIADHDGDVLVEASYVTDDDFPLGSRVNTMRTLYAQDPPLLSTDRIERLNAIGFVWSALDAAFETGLQHLSDYYAATNSLSMPKNYVTEDGFGLERWQSQQREKKANGDPTLTPARVARLEAIGFVWDPDEARWMEKFELTRRLASEKKSVLAITADDEIEGFKPYRWIIAQRKMEGKEQFNHRIELLKSLPGWAWNTHDAAFETGLAAMTRYRAAKNHANPPSGEIFEGFGIYSWASKRRNEKARNDPKLTPERIAALDALGFVWDADEDRWMMNFTAMKAWMRQHNNTMPPANEKFDGCNIGSWAATQRGRKRKNKLAANREALLGGLIGWEWEPGSGKASKHWKAG
jgi:superfamily II DNA or RNA helicase